MVEENGGEDREEGREDREEGLGRGGERRRCGKEREGEEVGMRRKGGRGEEEVKRKIG